MNNIQLIGNIATDIDIRATQSGKFVAGFNLAVTNPFNREKTVFLPIEIWGKQAENTAEYCSKGSKVGIVGHIDIDQWEKDGQKRSKTKVVANSIEFLTPKGSNTGGNTQGNTNTSGNKQNSSQGNYTKVNDDPFAGGGSISISDEDLPFAPWTEA